MKYREIEPGESVLDVVIEELERRRGEERPAVWIPLGLVEAVRAGSGEHL